MKQPKLTYRFENPNTVERTADYILALFIEANATKVDSALQQATQDRAQAEAQDAVYAM